MALHGNKAVVDDDVVDGGGEHVVGEQVVDDQTNVAAEHEGDEGNETDYTTDSLYEESSEDVDEADKDVDELANVNENGTVNVVDEGEPSEKRANLDDDNVMSDYSSDDYCGPNDLYSSDEEGEVDPMGNYINRPDVEIHDGMDLRVGDVFQNVKGFREALREYSIQEGFELFRIKNEKKRVTVRCAAEGCPWRIHASPLADNETYSIKTMTRGHTCVRVSCIKQATSAWIASKLVDVLKDNPNMKPKGIRSVLEKYDLKDLPYMQIYRSKKKAMEMIEGGYAEAYALLPKYAVMLKRSNPGSIVKIQSALVNRDEEGSSSATPQYSFERIFIGLEALRKGFLDGCSPFLGFDGCHLKGPYGGVLLAAIGLDGNNGLFPLAWTVVETECYESWSFFFRELEEMLGGFTEDKPWTFMSDRQKGLLEAINDQVPHAVNRRCARHILANFRAKFLGRQLRKYFWMASRSYSPYGFKFAMGKIKELKPEAYEWIMKIDPSMWSRHAYPNGLKNDHVTNNIAESFNAWVGEFRDKNVMLLLEGIRTKVMTRMHTRSQKWLNWTSEIMPNILKKLNDQRAWVRHCKLNQASLVEFEVEDKNFSYIVNLTHETCECKIWDVSGIPCRHACVAIAYNRQKIENFVDISFSKEVYMRAYSTMVHPVSDHKLWPPLENVEPSLLLPPALRRLPGRPRKNRRKEAWEAANGAGENGPDNPNDFIVSKTKCRTCGEHGHNKRTCQRGPTAQARKQKKRQSRKKRRTGQADCGETTQAGSVPTQVNMNSNIPLGENLGRMRSRRRATIVGENLEAGMTQGQEPYVPTIETNEAGPLGVGNGNFDTSLDPSLDHLFFF